MHLYNIRVYLVCVLGQWMQVQCRLYLCRAMCCWVYPYLYLYQEVLLEKSNVSDCYTNRCTTDEGWSIVSKMFFFLFETTLVEHRWPAWLGWLVPNWTVNYTVPLMWICIVSRWIGMSKGNTRPASLELWQHKHRLLWRERVSLNRAFVRWFDESCLAYCPSRWHIPLSYGMNPFYFKNTSVSVCFPRYATPSLTL